MSMDPSLKSKDALTGKRSVMTRAERVAALRAAKRLDEKKPRALGLPKTKVLE